MLSLSSSGVERLKTNAFLGNKIEYSDLDLKREVTLPRKLSALLAEETGIHIGDGSMNLYYGCSYAITVAGNRVDDKSYYENYLRGLYKQLYNIEPHIVWWSEGTIGFRFVSKAVAGFKHNVLGLPFGRKTDVAIPKKFFESKRSLTACLKGLFDTDGSLNFEAKYGKLPYYPRIEFSTTSKILSTQVFDALDCLGFNPKHRVLKYSNGWLPCNKITLRGYSQLEKWFSEIGTSNFKNVVKYAVWKKLGYCPPVNGKFKELLELYERVC